MCDGEWIDFSTRMDTKLGIILSVICLIQKWLMYHQNTWIVLQSFPYVWIVMTRISEAIRSKWISFNQYLQEKTILYSNSYKLTLDLDVSIPKNNLLSIEKQMDFILRNRFILSNSREQAGLHFSIRINNCIIQTNDRIHVGIYVQHHVLHHVLHHVSWRQWWAR